MKALSTLRPLVLHSLRSLPPLAVTMHYASRCRSFTTTTKSPSNSSSTLENTSSSSLGSNSFDAASAYSYSTYSENAPNGESQTHHSSYSGSSNGSRRRRLGAGGVAVALFGVGAAATTTKDENANASTLPSAATTLSSQPSQLSVYAWGSGIYGQLGTGVSDLSIATVPVHVAALDALNPTRVFAGAETAAAITADGSLYMWGRGDHGVLASGRPNAYAPELVEGLPPVVTMAISRTHAAAVDRDGRLWLWGARALGGLRKLSAPALLDAKELQGKRVVSVGCGLNHTVVVTDEGDVYSFGLNIDGALGTGSDKSEIIKPTPVKLRLPRNQPATVPKFTHVSCGKLFTLLLDENGTVWSCGDDSYGQTGQGARADRVAFEMAPIDLHPNERVVNVSAGESHAIAVTASGTVYSWGLGSEGQMGVGSKVTRNPTPLPNHMLRDSGVRAKEAAAGGGHSAVLAEDGNMWLMGRGQYGQLGRGMHIESPAAYRDKPVVMKLQSEVQGLEASKVVQIVLGTDTTFALVESAK